MQSQVMDTPNILIKQSKSGNVDIIKLNLQIINAEIVYDSVDKIQLDLTFSSHVNFQIIVYTFVTETKGAKQQRYEKSMPESTTQSFKCPSGLNYQFPSKYIEFMIIDLLRFKKMRVNPDAQYHTLIIEMKGLNSKGFQIIYFYRIDCNEQSYQCELINTKQIVIHKSRFFEIHELYGVQNTPFNPEWNPNTIEDKECVICFCNMINTVLLPCKHMCTCSTCADHILMSQKVKQCPLCRIDIDNYLTLEIKDKQKQDMQLRKFQEEQQKYLDSIKEKKEQQAIKHSSIMEQIKSKVQEEQLKQQQQKIKNMKYFDDLDEFNKDNQQNEDIYGNQSFCSYDENHSDPDGNQFNNSVKNKVQHQLEDENVFKSSHNYDEDKQKSTSHQRSPYDRGFLSSFKQQQEIKESNHNPKQESISVEDEMSQDQIHHKQQQQVSSQFLSKDDQSNLNSQQNSENQNSSSKQMLVQDLIKDDIQIDIIQDQRKESEELIIEFKQNEIQPDQKQQNSNAQLICFQDESQEMNQEEQESNIQFHPQQILQQQPQQFQPYKQQQQQQQQQKNSKQSYQYNYEFVEQEFQDDFNQFQQEPRNFPQQNDLFKTNQSPISNQSQYKQDIFYYKSARQTNDLHNDDQIFGLQDVQSITQRPDHGNNDIKQSESLIDLQDHEEEEKKDPSHSKELKSDQISLIAFD
ncbi:unnamed protein product (macronuclear) [Paramecium tetraurelia]|uniref:RING-type domain-containing protein n=1 Tax=Paramecium tetraurelia TaxID=5888 RepID=A0C595_PARTE|nr:uncharacterized protein GSPATT00006461001 [Paramecium tetraurelia]CAK65962.1 unnamed protein product [Paramecium tetraurelia]|eukprot:XP_001433359.1 hypothetical protein (macronuclear) [Paramecium tetraurelia strain d4-2]